jgi:hypothetical protein
MREIYLLTDATIDTLTDNVKRLSDWKGKTHIYNILDGTDTDPFAPFFSIYKGVLRAGLSTSHWDAELEHERRRHGRSSGARPAREVSVVEVHKEAFEAIDALLTDKPADVQKRELRELIAIAQQKIEGIERWEERQATNLRPVKA